MGALYRLGRESQRRSRHGRHDIDGTTKLTPRSSRQTVRPQILFPLFAQVTTLAGIGPRFGKLLEGLSGPHVADLLWHRPSGLIDRRFHPKVKDAQAGVIATITVTVDAHVKPYNPRQPYRVRCRDETGFLNLVF